MSRRGGRKRKEWALPPSEPIRCGVDRGGLRVTVLVEGLATNDEVAALPELLARMARLAVLRAAARMRGDSPEETDAGPP